ncbi:hypothetical protein GCM10027022_13480 [Alpinimonas psychrophila]|uniref:ABC-2 type transport system ATP-binding protein n=1 Tax=Alpinimonas psychrophila TaxID=748908 RepID=A0A7W3JU41_9MICO|nr:ABC transporter ATP-binding protein [Alpinimonas psychrophila]MBA8829238.1 ABC-2 type transport system ATP-binding protein [Alpinimonas psychrophila]
MSTTIARLEDVSKRFTIHQQRSLKEKIVNFGRGREFRKDFWALNDINLEIEFGTTVGLVGHNGSGKSTLLKIIGGILAPTTGSVARRGRMAALLELGAGFHHDLTGRENVYLNASILGLSKKEIDRVFDTIVDFSGIEQFIDTQVKFYSSGMYVRLAFAVAVHVDPDLLLVDEVLAVGDEPFQRKCIDKIVEFQREGRTIVVVSHSAAQVKQLCDRVVVLDHGLMLFDGDTAEGVRVLQRGYERGETSMAKVGAVVEQEFANKTAITRIEVSQPEIETGDVFISGEPLSITYRYRVAQNEGPLVASIMIENADRDCLYLLDTRMLGQSVNGNLGEHELTFNFAVALIGSGEYFVRAQLWLPDGRLMDELDPLPRFTMSNLHPGAGVISMDVSMSSRTLA